MYKRKGVFQSNVMATKDELTLLNEEETLTVTPSGTFHDVKKKNTQNTGNIEIDFENGIQVNSSAEMSRSVQSLQGSQSTRSKGIIGDAAAGICGGCMNKILMVISAILGVFVIIGGGLLAYQGTVATVGFNYVLWTFAGIEFIAGVYIIFRTFSLASTMAQLQKINNEFEETQEKLESEVDRMTEERERLKKEVGRLEGTVTDLQTVNSDLRRTSDELSVVKSDLQNTVNSLQTMNSDLQTVNTTLTQTSAGLQSEVEDLSSQNENLRGVITDLSSVADLLKVQNAEFSTNIDSIKHENANLHCQVNKFISAGKEFETQIEALRHERTELALVCEKLRTAISALASANDASLDIGKMISGILEDMERERDALTSEREAMERFSLQLSSAIFAEMDLNGDSTIDATEQSVWLKRIRG